ncbi:MAG: dihydrofolate reductase [Friedmanniella sp.]|nr:dihydrofolate reductase [Friedmanniella sp.]
MRKIVVTSWVSLDGFTAGPEGEMDWIHRYYDEEMGAYESALVRGGDTLLLGRVTYDSFAGSWPTVPSNPDIPEAERAYAKVLNAMRKVLISRSVTEPSWEHTDVLTDIRREEIEALKAEPGRDIIVYGSASVVGRLQDLGLVDEYHVIIYPVLLTGGKALFGGVTRPGDLTFVEAVTMASGAVRLVYRRS